MKTVPRSRSYAGFQRADYPDSQQVNPDVNYEPMVSDASSHTLSVGIGVSYKENGRCVDLVTCGSEGGFFSKNVLGIDASYQALMFETRTETGNPNSTVDGTCEPTTDAGSMTVRVNF